VTEQGVRGENRALVLSQIGTRLPTVTTYVYT